MGNKTCFIALLSLLVMAAVSSTVAAQASSQRRGYGLIKFEEQSPQYDPTQGSLISFEGQGHAQGNPQPFRFEDTQNYQQDPENSLGLDNGQNNPINFGQTDGFPEDNAAGLNTAVTIQDDNRIEGQKGQKKRKKRRRRRPRQQLPVPGAYQGGYPGPGVGYPAPGVRYPAPGVGYPAPGVRYPAPGVGYPASGVGYPTSEYGAGLPVPYGQNPNGGTPFAPGSYRPFHRPRLQSATAGALAAVTEALASIARYDDYQCVPRLLCEAAGGGAPGAGGASATGAGSGLLQSIAGLQPLLTLLSAYNGISASPLFVFGRAVLLGMASRGAPASPGAPAAACRYAYPLCPADPEQLVHYLNNHNGGFFRFFSAPQRPSPQYGLQDLQQFYSQLAVPVPGQQGQYGFYQPSANAGTSPDFGYGQTGYPVAGAQQYGLYNNIPNLPDPNYNRKPSNHYQHYGANYPYNGQKNYGFAKVGFKNNELNSKDIETNKIQRRIQNFKSEQYDEENFSSNIVDRNKNSKWLFPNGNRHESYVHSNKNNKNNNSKQFVFPKENFISDTNRKAKGFNFPGAQSNRDLNFYAYAESAQSDDHFSYNQDHAAVAQTERPPGDTEEGAEVVYIVRGGGDPKNPEIVHLRPGRTIQSIGYI